RPRDRPARTPHAGVHGEIPAAGHRQVGQGDPRCRHQRGLTRMMLRIIVALALALIAAPASAQDWSARPVTMVVPFPPGGGVDTGGRIMASKLSELLGQQVIVENVPRAGGMLGAARVAKAPPDGYQSLLGHPGT